MSTDIYAVRRKRLIELLESPRFNGSKTALWKAAGITSGRLSHLLDSGKPFGELAASNLETSLGLPPGYFNGDRPETPKQKGELSAAATELALLFDLIPIDDRLRRASAYAKASQSILDALQLPQEAPR